MKHGYNLRDLGPPDTVRRLGANETGGLSPKPTTEVSMKVETLLHVSSSVCVCVSWQLRKEGSDLLPEDDGHYRGHQQEDHRAGDDQGSALQRRVRVIGGVDHLKKEREKCRQVQHASERLGISISS